MTTQHIIKTDANSPPLVYTVAEALDAIADIKPGEWVTIVVPGGRMFLIDPAMPVDQLVAFARQWGLPFT